jgi:hypothetical protein
MIRMFRLAVAAGWLCLAACQPAPDANGTASPPSTTGAAANPATDAMAPPTAGEPAAAPTFGGGDDYACADGTRLQVAFGGHAATLRWSGGRTVTLPRAESASKSGGDAYVGDTVSLERDGTRLTLHDGERAATDCAARAASDTASGHATGDDAVADQYACDAGARLIRKDDGSFRAEVPGNAPVRLSRITGSDPAVFTGSSLYLRIDPDGTAILSQGDRTNELRCSAGQAHA